MNLSNLKKAIKDFIYGYTVVGPLHTIREQVLLMDITFMTVTYGDMLGLPFTPPIYKYKLLPHFLPLIQIWKKTMLKEKDITEKMRES